MQRRIVTIIMIVSFTAVAAIAPPTVVRAQQSRPPLAKVSPAQFGEPFPAARFKNLNAEAGGPSDIDLSQVLGLRPVVLCYWIPKNRRAEHVLLETQELATELGSSKIALFGVTTVGATMDADAVQARAREIGVRVPILMDAGFRIGQELMVQTVPNLSIIDRSGRLRLTNGATLSQTLEYNMTVADGLRRVAETGKLGTYGPMPRYYPANELVGKPSPDFKATSLTDGIVHRWSKLIDPAKLNVLVFWSIDCPHCQKQLPEINDYVKNNQDVLNVVTAARITNDAMKTKTREFTKINEFVVETLIDDQDISERYLVITTPSIFIVGPDGTVDSVLLSGSESFATHVEARIKELLPGSKG